MQAATCRTCGEPGRYSKFVIGVRKGVGAYEKPVSRPGWAHQDGMKRDHTFHPHDNRSPEVDVDRQREGRLMAGLEVDHTLQEQFAHRHAQDAVDRLFNDRRE